MRKIILSVLLLATICSLQGQEIRYTEASDLNLIGIYRYLECVGIICSYLSVALLGDDGSNNYITRMYHELNTSSTLLRASIVRST